MKKLIALLGAVTLTASSASLVVACGNTTVPEYDNFAKLANATRPTLNDNNEIEQKGSTLVYYIGAEDNLSSLSFEYALKKSVGLDESASLEDAFEKLNESNSSTNDFAGKFKGIGDTFTANNVNGDDALRLVETNVTYNKKKDLWYFENQTDLSTFSAEATGTKIEMHGTTVDTVGDLWTDKATKKILNDWIKPSIARMVYANIDKHNQSWDKTKDKEQIKKVNDEINSRTEAIKNSKGPLFLIIRNGEFVGYLEGFEAYNQVKKDGDNPDLGKSDYKENDLINNFINGMQSVVHTKDIMTKTYKSDNTNYNLNSTASNQWKWQNWDNWVIRDSKTSSESGESYSYNLNKY
ncbi:lipoprotein [Mesoplasma florum]|uniref:lipoprotein n=1 Tax=Mesoplasma florum TaxID=2151 RepID=UPI000BE48B97|nr:lipoprotein [Mesoplasma florum]ATI73343.1 hypothetical protein CQZ69_02065 [Mesoplasma florum]AVN61744.1 hypothetical protein CG004_02065 [Mesoplasma florum]